jgi:hypothetical protein
MTLGNLAPPLPILAAFAASIAMPFLLMIYARWPGRISLTQRFWLAMGTAAGSWLFVIGWVTAIAERNASPELLFDMAAGVAILLTAGLFVYSIWSLASFGFTILMLVSLAHKGGALSRDAWADCYGQGHGMNAFTQDRITVLVEMGLVIRHDDQLRLNGPFATRFAKLVIFVAHVFGIRIEQ